MIRRSSGAPVATAHAVSPRAHADFAVVQLEAKVLMLSENAAVDLPRSNIEAERVKPTSRTAKVMRTEGPRNRDSLLEIVRAFGCLVDGKNDLVLSRKVWIPAEKLRYFMIVPPCEFVSDVFCPWL